MVFSDRRGRALADDPSDQLGPDVPIGYSSLDLTSVVSVLQGIKAAAPNATVSYARGCDATCTSTAGFGAAVSAAKSSAVTVIVAGEPASYSGEASSRSDIGLPGQQTALIQAVAATGKPYVVVLMSFPRNVGQIPISCNELPTGRPYDPTTPGTTPGTAWRA